MSETGQGAARVAARRGGRRFFRSWMAIALLAVLVAVAGGVLYGFFGYRLGDHGRHASGQAPPLPFYLTLKPFVVSMAGDAGTTHFVQVGVTLTLSGPAPGRLVNAVLPEVEDAMRQTVLAFKADDVMTPAGVDKLRKAMIVKVNNVLLQQLGARRIEDVNNGKKNLVRNIYFSSLIVE
jgi:flagellar basal body-associated protein FliL